MIMESLAVFPSLLMCSVQLPPDETLFMLLMDFPESPVWPLLGQDAEIWNAGEIHHLFGYL